MTAVSASRRVLVTGATGFVGAHAIRLLAARDWEVHGARRAAPPPAPATATPARRDTGNASSETGIVWHACDLRDPDAGRALIGRVRPTHLLHLAWNAEHGAYWAAPDNDAWAEGTIALARAFAEGGGQRLVAAGTCAEYDWTDLREACREGETPCRPQTVYGRAKLRAAEGVLSAARETEMSAAWGRLFFLYGPGEDARRLIPSVARALAAGQRAKVTAGTQVRDFLHVHDAAEAFVALLTAAVEGPVNIGSGQAVSIRALIEMLARAAGRPEGVDFGAVPMQQGEPPVIVADIARLLATGWRQRIPLEQGLANVCVES